MISSTRGGTGASLGKWNRLLAGVALGVLATSVAQAECLRSLGPSGREITCTDSTESLFGDEADLIAITPGALLGGAAAAPLVVPQDFGVTVRVDGTVDARASLEAAIRYDAVGLITVGATGQVLAGAGDGIVAGEPRFEFGNPDMTLTNRGLIQAGGRAVVVNSSTRSLGIINELGGRIEGSTAIAADAFSVDTVRNAGEIVGTGPVAGSRSA